MNINLADVGAWIAFLAALIGSCGAIFAAVQKVLKKLFATQTKDIQTRLDSQGEAIKRVDLENCKNFLVSFLSRCERGDKIDEIEKARFWEQYEHYRELGGNAYIGNKVESLKKEEKL